MDSELKRRKLEQVRQLELVAQRELCYMPSPQPPQTTVDCSPSVAAQFSVTGATGEFRKCADSQQCTPSMVAQDSLSTQKTCEDLN